MNNLTANRVTGIMAAVGETLVVVAAALWVFVPDVAAFMLSAGTLLFIVGRTVGNNGDGYKAIDHRLNIASRHLYRQRMLSYVLLIIAAVTIHLSAGFYLGIYIRRSSWLIPFIAFAIIEVYTAFRLKE